MLWFALYQSMEWQYGIHTKPKTSYALMNVGIQNKFLAHVAHTSKIVHPHHDYSLLRSSLNITTLTTCRSEADLRFIPSLLNISLDTLDLLSSINFRVPTCIYISHSLFSVSSHSAFNVSNQPIHLFPLICYFVNSLLFVYFYLLYKMCTE